MTAELTAPCQFFVVINMVLREVRADEACARKKSAIYVT